MFAIHLIKVFLCLQQTQPKLIFSVVALLKKATEKFCRPADMGCHIRKCFYVTFARAWTNYGFCHLFDLLFWQDHFSDLHHTSRQDLAC